MAILASDVCITLRGIRANLKTISAGVVTERKLLFTAMVVFMGEPIQFRTKRLDGPGKMYTKCWSTILLYCVG